MYKTLYEKAKKTKRSSNIAQVKKLFINYINDNPILKKRKLVDNIIYEVGNNQYAIWFTISWLVYTPKDKSFTMTPKVTRVKKTNFTIEI